ncbi:hypothetical protein LSH36_359g05011 [Paralvinella palmiformis]|uniref:Uncharacterized protein n=1 Tax=Paralvinella palmiformis TaxID=53620 RepID=A0AAD9N292_9ANNE|nr:hypothetical protein LSH36_359g05011 [Paralvinella palmiformis]
MQVNSPERGGVSISVRNLDLAGSRTCLGRPIITGGNRIPSVGESDLVNAERVHDGYQPPIGALYAMRSRSGHCWTRIQARACLLLKRCKIRPHDTAPIPVRPVLIG